MRWLRYEALGRFFNWQYSGWFIAIFIAAGIGLWGSHEYDVTYILFVVAGCWSLLYWQFSGFMIAKLKASRTARSRFAAKPKSDARKADAIRAQRAFAGWNLLVSSVIVAIVAVLVMFIHRDKLQYRKLDVLQHLQANVALPPSHDVWQTVFSIRNGSSQRIRYSVDCSIVSVLTENGSLVANELQLYKSPVAMLEAFGDTESLPCMHADVVRSPVVCADVEMHVHFTVADDLADDQGSQGHKNFRFYGYREDAQFAWYQKPVDLKRSYCGTT